MESPQQIQLELPDYSEAYIEYMRKKQEQLKQNDQPDTVIIIDIY